MIIKHTDPKGNIWYLHKILGKNKKIVYFMKKTQEDVASVDERWLRDYEIIQGTNCPLIKKRR